MKFGIAIEELNQHKTPLERVSENTEANEKICRPGRLGPVRPLSPIGQTGLAGVQKPRPVRPVAPRQIANKASNANLEQTKSKSNETWRKASQLPHEHILKRSFS